MWRCCLMESNIDRIRKDVHIVLSDFSSGMIKDAKEKLGLNADRFEFKLVNANNLTYTKNSFDKVIANLMLYHVANRKKTISEISRILKPDGTLYAAAFGNDNMIELTEIVS